MKLLLAFCLMFCSTILEAQAPADTSDVLDSLDVERGIEALVEQSTADEDSPLLDELTSRSAQPRSKSFEVRSRIIQKLQRSRGYLDRTYLGSSLSTLDRIRIASGNIFSAGAILQKDAGERRLNDFTSGFVRLSTSDVASSLIVGDYIVEAGQGVVLWRGYDVQKGADVVAPVKREGRDLVPFNSSDENAFFRGVAISSKFGSFRATMFYSRKSLSATLDVPDSGAVTSFYTAGYFRTETEEAKRNDVDERVLGGRVLYDFSSGNHLGATWLASSYSRRLYIGSGTQFDGDRLQLFSLDYNVFTQQMRLYGEWVRSHMGTLAGVSGIILSPSTALDVLAVYRNYPTEFFSLHGNAFSERSGLSNERGMYCAIRMRPVRHFLISGYFDQFQFPSSSFTSRFPSHGTDALVQIEMTSIRNLRLTGRYGVKQTEEDQKLVDDFGREKNVTGTFKKTRYRLHADLRVSNKIELRSRFEYADVVADSAHRREKGIMLFQDVRMRPSSRWRINLRLAIFRTDSYDAGIAEYENDVPGALAVPVLYGRGVRWYALIQYDVFSSLQLSLKYSDLIRDDVKRIGSGLDELHTNHDNRIGMQLDFGI